MQEYEWNPIQDAPKDGTIVWAVFRDDIYPKIKPERKDLESWNGVQAPIKYLGDTLLWSIAIPVGHGGFPDAWIDGWVPLRNPPSKNIATVILEQPLDYFLIEPIQESIMREVISGCELITYRNQGYFDSKGNYYSDMISDEKRPFWIKFPDGEVHKRNLTILGDCYNPKFWITI